MSKSAKTLPTNRALAAICACLLALVGNVHTGWTQARPADDQVKVSNPFSGRADIQPEGRTLFNVHCSHCHGPNAFQGERRRDLRRLRRRYREDMTAVFLKTALNGRPEKGMPPWQDVISEEELWKIFTFLETVQQR